VGLCVRVLEQKWSKGKVREKVANKVLFDNDLYTRLSAEIPKVRPTPHAKELHDRTYLTDGNTIWCC
jgi:ribosomal protein S25